jgi:hypothetical protein
VKAVKGYALAENLKDEDDQNSRGNLNKTYIQKAGVDRLSRREWLSSEIEPA